MGWKALYRPAGRRGPRVYWRRRLFAICFVFLVALVGVWAVAHGGAPQPTGAAVYAVATPIQPSASPSTTGSAADAQPQAPPNGAGDTTPGAQASAGPQAPDVGEPGFASNPGVPVPTAEAEAAPPACQDRDVSVRVSPSVLQVNRGGEVAFALVVSDRSLGACDVAGLVRTVQVQNGAGPVWSSSRCGSPATGPTVVRPGAPVTFQVTWNTRSCGLATSGPVAPGAYDVIGRTGDVSGFGGTLVVS